MKKYEEEIKDIINNTIYACECEVGFDGYETSGNLATIFTDDIRFYVKEFSEVNGHREEIKALMDKCDRYFDRRIYEAVENALSQADEALKEELYDIEHELHDLIDIELAKYEDKKA